MVSSQFQPTTATNLLKPFKSLSIVKESPENYPYDNLELEFSDVFGPVQSHGPLPQISEDSAEFTVHAEVNEVYDEPDVVQCRKHSYVGPTTIRNQPLRLSRQTPEIVGELSDDSEENLSESYDTRVDSNMEKAAVLEDFEFLKLVGQGAFGKVYQVRKIGSSEIFAMKVMRKDKIMEKNHAEYMKTERDILTKIDHPFIVQLRYSFQTKYRLYLVLDFVNGGHLFFQLYHQGLFREADGRVYTAEIVSAVSHLHKHGIMHRDLKPENILLDAEGHAMLTDFGLAKQFIGETRSNSMCGTLEYMAPEIILGKGHDKAADWWSVGILLYEMLTGKPPFIGGNNRQKIQQKILKDKIKLPAYLSSEAHSLIKGLLQKDPRKRLSCDEIKSHKWFKSINWKKLEDREILPGFIPHVEGKQCTANFDERWTKMPLQDSPASSPKENPFQGFSYVRPASRFPQVNLS
ncbi:serine/threonine-protein kinase AtPK2/AtPK19-like [Andrographis paniculata]|uniref:serine/threonine-protein kinase AtPK2/AtPK19-like n=1 Tax=Andrographis paniculata TaxID=175694 RepID=UPI0021E77230|nr:serine/threonine-protein kinase AtPK2/AtPK19-like [Andrographis paniculata]